MCIGEFYIMSKYNSVNDKDEDSSNSAITENSSKINSDKHCNNNNNDIMARPPVRIRRLLRFPCQLTIFVLEKLVFLCSTTAFVLLLAYWFYGGIIILILLHISVLGILYNLQDMLLFQPSQPPNSQIFVDSPAAVGLPHEIIKLKTPDGVTLTMFLIKQAGPAFSTAATIVYFHGNAGNIGHRLYNVQALQSYCCVNVLLVEYRGYGLSSGSPSEQGLYIDAQAALDYIYSRSDINQQAIIVFGRSLGGAVAIQACSQPYNCTRVAAMIVENTFTSVPDMARKLFDFLVVHCLPDFCHKNKFPSRSRVPKVSVPSLFVSGQRDELVPPIMMLSLFENSGGDVKRLALFTGGSHNDTWQQRGYYDMINKFFTEVWSVKRGERIQKENVFTVH